MKKVSAAETDGHRDKSIIIFYCNCVLHETKICWLEVLYQTSVAVDLIFHLSINLSFSHVLQVYEKFLLY